MAIPSEQRSKALHNEDLLDVHKLAEGKFAGWAITNLFYSALRWTRALATTGAGAKSRGPTQRVRATLDPPLRLVGLNEVTVWAAASLFAERSHFWRQEGYMLVWSREAKVKI